MNECQKDVRACADLIGRKALAKYFHVGKTTVTDWYNNPTGQPMKVWIFCANTLALEKNKDGRGISIQKLERITRISLVHLQERNPPPAKLPHFDRFEASQLDPAWKAKRWGRPALISENKEKMCATEHTFKGRILDYIREKYGLGGKKQYKQTQEIWEKKRKDLIEAGRITVSQAHQLLAENVEMTAELLCQGEKAILLFFKEKRCAEKNNRFSYTQP